MENFLLSQLLHGHFSAKAESDVQSHFCKEEGRLIEGYNIR